MKFQIIAFYLAISYCTESVKVSVAHAPYDILHELALDSLQMYKTHKNGTLDVEIEIIDTANLGTGDYLTVIYDKYLGAKLPDLDIFAVDVIYPGVIMPDTLNLANHLDESAIASEHVTNIFDNNIVTLNNKSTSLVALPYFADYGILFYRKDLCVKYDLSCPPTTYDELEIMAEIIQTGERSEGQANFHGWVWEGKGSEGLTCGALEWIGGHGGGNIVESDGTISINNDDVKTALNRAKNWIGWISPLRILNMRRPEIHDVWLEGNAAFTRNWPYLVKTSNSHELLAGKFGIAQLPSGKSGSNGRGTLGGWAWGISKYTDVKEEAVDYLKYITTPEFQKYAFLEYGFTPTTTENLNLGNDLCMEAADYEAKKAAANPFVAEDCCFSPPEYMDPSNSTDIEIKNNYTALWNTCSSGTSDSDTSSDTEDICLFGVSLDDYIIARPSTISGSKYPEISKVFYETVNKILVGEVTVSGGLESMECEMAGILGQKIQKCLDPCGENEIKTLNEAGEKVCHPPVHPGETAQTFVLILCSIGLAMIAIVAIGILIFRKRRAIHNASPFLCLVSLLGCALLMTSSYIQTLPMDDVLCLVNPFLFHIGFMISIGCLYGRTWRIKKLFINKFLKRRSISSIQLFGFVCGFVAVDLVILGLWSTIDRPMIRGLIDVDSEKLQRICASANNDVGLIFTLALGATKAVLLGSTIWVTYKVKDTPDVFNESKSMSLAIYTIAIVSTVIVALLVAAGDRLQAYGQAPLIQSFSTFIGSLALVVFVFASRVVRQLTNSDEKDAIPNSGTSGYSSSSGKAQQHHVNNHSNNSSSSIPKSRKPLPRNYDKASTTTTTTAGTTANVSVNVIAIENDDTSVKMTPETKMNTLKSKLSKVQESLSVETKSMEKLRKSYLKHQYEFASLSAELDFLEEQARKRHGLI